jgi:hypothetical protein
LARNSPLSKGYGARGREPLMPTPLQVCTASQPALRWTPYFTDQRRMRGRGRRPRWVHGGGELGGWTPAARWVGSRGWRSQQPHAEPQGSRSRLGVPQELARRLLTTDHGHVLGWRSGAEGRVGVMGLDAEEGARDEFSPAMVVAVEPWPSLRGTRSEWERSQRRGLSAWVLLVHDRLSLSCGTTTQSIHCAPRPEQPQGLIAESFSFGSERASSPRRFLYQRGAARQRRYSCEAGM